MTVTVYDNTAVFPLPKISLKSSPKLTAGQRGGIHGFSLASVRRLREALAILHIPNSRLCGLTLTVPWRKEFPLDVYKASCNRAFTLIRRKFPLSGSIYRHELQTRGAPHCHMIFYVSNKDTASLEYFAGTCRNIWLKACPLLNGSYRAFSRYGVKCQSVDDQVGLWRYYTDHCSKHKQAQLGYEGKQWGILNRSAFVKRSSVSYDLTDREYIAVRRQLSRLYRYCKKSDCVFGYKHLNRRQYTKITFGKSKSIEKIIRYYTSKKN